MPPQPRHIGDILRERNIELVANDPVVRGGFSQVPNFILKHADLSLGAKVTYSMFLHYAWHNDSCFPGQERLANDMGMSQSREYAFGGAEVAASPRMFPDILSLIARRDAPPPRDQPAGSRRANAVANVTDGAIWAAPCAGTEQGRRLVQLDLGRRPVLHKTILAAQRSFGSSDPPHKGRDSRGVTGLHSASA